MWRWVLEFVVCPVCRRGLVALDTSDDERDGVLGHASGDCAERYPVIGAVPRLLVGAARARLRTERAAWFDASSYGRHFEAWPSGSPSLPEDLRLISRFDHEWNAFARVGTVDQRTIFVRYFDIVPPQLLAQDRIALDAGCGAGRWAHEVASAGPRVIAVDLGLSVEVAERNTRTSGRVACVQADARDVPVRDSAIDLVYSLGVLHHVARTEDALRGLARLLRPNGAMLVYLYYALDGRSDAYRSLFRLSDVVRRIASPLPQAVLVAVTTAIAATVYLPLGRLSRLLRRFGARQLAESVPLSFYADLSFETMRNDSLDRFGTSLEKRYSREEFAALLRSAGLEEVTISAGPPYWHGMGRGPGARG